MVAFHSYHIYVTWKTKEVVRRREVLKPSYAGEGEGGCNFYGMHLTTLDIMLTIFSLVIAPWLIDDVNHHMHLFLLCTYSKQFQTFFSMPLKNLQVPLKVLHKMVNSFVTQRIRIKLIHSFCSGNKLYL